GTTKYWNQRAPISHLCFCACRAVLPNHPSIRLSHEPLFECAPSWNSNAAFPLTPPLSPRERENRSPLLHLSAAPRRSQNRNACLPLPKGEGRGEGEGNDHQHDGFAILVEERGRNEPRP